MYGVAILADRLLIHRQGPTAYQEPLKCTKLKQRPVKVDCRCDDLGLPTNQIHWDGLLRCTSRCRSECNLEDIRLLIRYVLRRLVKVQSRDRQTITVPLTRRFRHSFRVCLTCIFIANKGCLTSTRYQGVETTLGQRSFGYGQGLTRPNSSGSLHTGIKQLLL